MVLGREMELIVLIAIVGGLWLAISALMRAEKRKRLLAKYGDPEIVRQIMDRTIWQGETKEQLVDSLGSPVDIDTKVLKAKIRETWKYYRTGKNRFNLRVILEDSIVVGWDKKG